MPYPEREITTHKIGAFNKEHISVYAIDEVQEKTGANHDYEIHLHQSTEAGKDVLQTLRIKLQKGPLKEAGANGFSDQALIAIVLDRLQGFQKGEYPSTDNEEAISHLELCLEAMARRYKERANRGVEGTWEK